MILWLVLTVLIAAIPPVNGDVKAHVKLVLRYLTVQVLVLHVLHREIALVLVLHVLLK